MRLPPVIFEYEAPRTHAWDVSFSISGKWFANRLFITDFDLTRLKELKDWASNFSSLLNLKPGKLTWS